MWSVLVCLLLFLLLQLLDGRYKHLLGQRKGEFEQAFAVGQNGRPFWKECIGLSITVLSGFVISTVLGGSGIDGAIAAGSFTVVYFEGMRYPIILLIISPNGTQISFGNLRSIYIDINSETQIFFDGDYLQIYDETSLKRIKFCTHDFPEVDFPMLQKWLTEVQNGMAMAARKQANAIDGFRTPERVLDLISPHEAQPHRLLFLCLWFGVLFVFLRRIFGV